MNSRDRRRYPYTTVIHATMAQNDGTDENRSWSYHEVKRVFHSAFELSDDEKELLMNDEAKVHWSDGLGKNFTFDRPIDEKRKIWITDEFFNNDLTESEGFIQKEDK